MKTLKKTPFLEGTAMSEELTSIGKQLRIYLEFGGKLVRVASEQQTFVKTDKPAGQEVFQKVLEREQAQRQKPLSDREKKKLEEQTKYDLSTKKIGNAQSMFNLVMHEITSENKHWNELIKMAQKEIERLCTQTGAMEKARSYDVTEGL